MQVCKRGAPSARAIGLNEMCGRGSGKAACVSSAKIFCSIQFFEQGPVLSSKCSAEVLDGQLASAVLRSSVWWGRTLACILGRPVFACLIFLDFFGPKNSPF